MKRYTSEIDRCTCIDANWCAQIEIQPKSPDVNPHPLEKSSHDYQLEVISTDVLS